MPAERTAVTPHYQTSPSRRAFKWCYRAAASIDLEHDEGDIDKKISCPLLVLWGANGLVGRKYDALSIWRERATHVSGKALPGGQWIPEECPHEMLAEIISRRPNSPTTFDSGTREVLLLSDVPPKGHSRGFVPEPAVPKRPVKALLTDLARLCPGLSLDALVRRPKDSTAPRMRRLRRIGQRSL